MPTRSPGLPPGEPARAAELEGSAAAPEGPAREGSASPLRVSDGPHVYLVGRQVVDPAAIDQFLKDNDATWSTDTEVGAERLAEAGGRLCYMSFGKGRKSNREFLGHILEVGHGSVLEHAVWNFILTGVSRSLTHELIRHRAGFGFSQLSQRYVNESGAEFIEPSCIAADPEADAIFRDAVQAARRAYDRLVARLEGQFGHVENRTLRRKLARQAARSVLPNATETRIFVTANARALRHFIELRGSYEAEDEIRRVALILLELLQAESPGLFGDFRIETRDDGTRVAVTPHHKV